MHEVSAVMLLLAKKSFGKRLVKKACPGGFNINWTQFYQDLRIELVHRAFDRFCVFHEKVTNVVYGKKKQRVRHQEQDEDSGEDSDVVLIAPEVKKFET